MVLDRVRESSKIYTIIQRFRELPFLRSYSVQLGIREAKERLNLPSTSVEDADCV